MAAALLAWTAFAWVPGGAWAIPALALLHALDGWRHERAVRQLPWRRPQGAFGAAWVLAAVSAALATGYRPDWLIQAGLVTATVIRLTVR